MAQRRGRWLLSGVLLALALLATSPLAADAMSLAEQLRLTAQTREMFQHAYDAYITHAFPADELMPLSCKGRVRGKTPSRGDIDDALGGFSLTLVDTLDSLAILGNFTEFFKACRIVIATVTFDTDVVVSTFETNIRVLGGLLGAHSLIIDLKAHPKKVSPTMDPFLLTYNSELLAMARDLGDRLLAAFDTNTGLPYTRINLRHGATPKVRRNDATCTACAGTMIMEFGALSRFTGDAKYERAARRALEALWSRRGAASDLVGRTINITSGVWLQRDSGVGAGIDSYYEYLFKAYILLGDQAYLQVFNKHYTAIMTYLRRGPYLVNTDMNNPKRLARKFMDALQTFWPGLQVLKGDVTPAIETHRMYFHLTERYGFIPESFTADFKVNWANYPLRPEFAESTYFLHRATKDPFYLEVGKSILESYQTRSRVACGFAAISDVRTWRLEDKMDSFVLAETFKYLYLLFSDDDTVFDLDNYVFTTEAHLLPISLSSVDSGLEPLVMDAAMVYESTTEPETHDHSCLPRHDQEFLRFQRLVHLNPRELKICPVYNINIAHLPVRAPKASKQRTVQAKVITPEELDIEDPTHMAYLETLGIMLVTTGANVRLIHQSDESHANYSQGLAFMKTLIALAAQRSDDTASRAGLDVVFFGGGSDLTTLKGGPAAFGPDLGASGASVSASAVWAQPHLACTPLTNPNAVKGHIVLVRRGGCMFVEKIRFAEAQGAIGVVVIDNHKRTAESPPVFTMSGDGTDDDVSIPAAFLYGDQAEPLLDAVASGQQIVVELKAQGT